MAQWYVTTKTQALKEKGYPVPTVTLPLPETYMSIERPATLDVIRQVKDATQISDHDLVISYRGISENSQLVGGSLTPAKDPADSAYFRQAGKVAVVVSEQYDEASYLTVPLHYPDALLVFNDSALRTFLKPIYSSTDVTIEFTYRAQSRHLAEAWRNHIRNRIKQNADVLSHDIAYEFGIPKPFLVTLGEIHRLRETVAPYNQEFGTWFKEHVSKKLTVLTKLDGGKPHLVFKENQINVHGWFDFSEPPALDKGDVGSLWNVSFTYRFRYEKPTHMVLYYPLTIHNQLLPEAFRARDLETTYHRMIGDLSLSNQRFDFFRKVENHYYEQYEGVRIPYFDEWYPTTLPFRQSSLLLVLCQIDPTDPTLVLDLNALGEYSLHPDFLAYLRKHHEALTHGKINPFIVSLYEYEIRMDSESLYVDENLVVRTRQPMDLRKVYRLHLGLTADLSILTENTEDALRNDPPMCLAILNALGPNLEASGLLPKVVGGRLIPKIQYRAALEHLRTTHPAYIGGRGYANVGLFIITTQSGRP